MSEQNTTPFCSNQNQESQSNTQLQLQQPPQQASYSNSNQIIVHQQQQHRVLQPQTHYHQVQHQQSHGQIVISNRLEQQGQFQQQQQQPHGNHHYPQQQLQQPQGHYYQHPQQQQISELKPCNFIASIPTTNGKRPTLGFQIQEVLPNPALPVILLGDLLQTSDPSLISASLPSNQKIQATQGCRDGTNSLPVDGLSKCFHISYKSLIVCHPILRYQDTKDLICQFPLPTPIQSLKQSLFPTKIFCINRNSSDLSDLKIEPFIHHKRLLENKILTYKYNSLLGERIGYNPQIRIDYQSPNKVDFGPVESTLCFKAIKRNNQLPSTTSQAVVLQQQQQNYNYMRTSHPTNTSTSIVSQITPSNSQTNQTNGFITASSTTSNIKSASDLAAMMHKQLVSSKEQILCKYCGIVNSISDTTTCSRCNQTLNNNNIVEEKQQLTAKNKRNSKNVIDLAMDDDNPPNKRIKPMESNNNHSLNNSNHHSTSGSNDSALINQKNSLDLYSQVHDQLIAKFTELKGSSSTDQFTTLDCRSIRIGPYKVLTSCINKEKLRICLSSSGIYFKLSHAVTGDLIECAIPIGEVLNCCGYLKHRLPVLFIYTGPKLAHFLETKLGIENVGLSQSPQFAFEIDPPKDMDELLIRKVFGNNYTDIEYTKANSILVTMAEVNQNNEMNGNNNNKKNKSSASSSSSSAIVPRNQTTRSQKNFEANLSAVADLNKTESSLLPLPDLGITITTRDIMCLNENSFLNDNIIDFYLNHLYRTNLTPEQQEKCFIFPTHFFYLLNRKKNNIDKMSDKSTITTPNQRKHAKVAKITKNVDIFAKDFLFVPICEAFHWYMAVICFPGLKGPHDLETNEELPDFKELDKRGRAAYPKKIKEPVILIFDSLADNRGRIITLLREYLQVEYSIKKSDADGFIIDRKVMGGQMPRSPQQTNAIDCGLFILEYFRYFYQDPITDYKVSVLNLEKKRWFHPKLPSNLRKVIFDTLHPLLEEKNPDELSKLPQVKFPEYVDPATVKFTIKVPTKKKELPAEGEAAAEAGASTSASTSEPKEKEKSKPALRPVIVSSFSIGVGPRRSITTATSTATSSPARRLNAEQLIVKEPPAEQPQEEEEEEELMDL